jgi:hypothetical protein
MMSAANGEGLLMPVDDWTRVDAGIFHDFHHDWITMLKRTLNGGLLPEGYYALAKQIAGGLGRGVLTLDLTGTGRGEPRTNGPSAPAPTDPGGIALATSPPKARFTAAAEMDPYARKRNRIVIRHVSGHRVVAMIEIVSPGNKASRQALRSFVDKAIEVIDKGIHLLVVDLFPPGPRDPQGIHAAIWSEIEDHDFRLAADKPLTLATYSAGLLKRAFIEPVAVGDALPEMAVFLEPEQYINVPMEPTYQAAYEGLPRYYRNILEGK